MTVHLGSYGGVTVTVHLTRPEQGVMSTECTVTEIPRRNSHRNSSYGACCANASLSFISSSLSCFCIDTERKVRTLVP